MPRPVLFNLAKGCHQESSPILLHECIFFISWQTQTMPPSPMAMAFKLTRAHFHMML